MGLVLRRSLTLALSAILTSCQPYPYAATSVTTLVNGQDLKFVPGLKQAGMSFEAASTSWEPADVTRGPRPDGTVWVADAKHHRILRVSALGEVSLYAGADSPGKQDGSADEARFDQPHALLWLGATLFVADAGNHCLRKLSEAEDGSVIVETLHLERNLKRPVALAPSSDQRLYVADAGLGQILKVDPRTGKTEELLQVEADHLLGAMAWDSHLEALVYLDNTGLWQLKEGRRQNLVGPSSHLGRIGGFLTWNDGLILSDLQQHRLLYYRYGTGAHPPELKTLLEASDFAREDQPALNDPGALMRDYDGSIVLAELGHQRLRRLELKTSAPSLAGLKPSDWQLETLAQNGTQGFGVRHEGEDLSLPEGVLFVPDAHSQGGGHLLVSDYYHNRLLNIDPQGRAEPFFDKPQELVQAPSQQPEQVALSLPAGLAQAPNGELYVASSGSHQIFRYDARGRLLQVYGTGQAGFQDGPADRASFRLPWGLALRADRTLLVADHGNHAIREITSEGQVRTLAGTREGNRGLKGFVNGPALQARFYFPTAVLPEADGSVLVADSWNHCLRRISANGRVSTFAGDGVPDLREGPRQQARFYLPSDLARAPDGRLYIADTWNHRIRVMLPSGYVSTYAGQGRWLNWNGGHTDGAGASARFDQPRALSLDPATGRIFVADTENNRIREIWP